MTFTASSLDMKHEEKRDFIRMQINSTATITKGDGNTMTGFCINLSGGGALLELDNSENVAEELAVTINSSHGHAPVFHAQGRVVRSTLNSRSERYLVAIKY